MVKSVKPKCGKEKFLAGVQGTILVYLLRNSAFGAENGDQSTGEQAEKVNVEVRTTQNIEKKPSHFFYLRLTYNQMALNRNLLHPVQVPSSSSTSTQVDEKWRKLARKRRMAIQEKRGPTGPYN
ncbi:hypothetical protein JTB14_037193 [Gonioctena quinquepunctata]|nr:hypothetical protein JTB14_037193 [Gonioctena quinquepunctata]